MLRRAALRRSGGQLRRADGGDTKATKATNGTKTSRVFLIFVFFVTFAPMPWARAAGQARAAVGAVL
jgi:hypothetical protein